MQLMEHEAPGGKGGGGVGWGSLPQCMLCSIFKALFIDESTLILRYKQKLFVVGTLTEMSYVCHHIFLSIAQIGPCFQGPIHG